MSYKRILIQLTHSGFYDAGFIKLTDIKEMDEYEKSEIFKEKNIVKIQH